MKCATERTPFSLAKQLLPTLAVLLFCGCGATFVGFVSNPGGFRTVTGTVTIVSIGVVDDGHGNMTPFTAVTFTQGATSAVVNFCGDQRSLFPIGKSVRADFTDGIFCSTLHTVTVGP